MRNEYVLGFLYHEDWVALIQKKRPDWQAGKLNGIGGHINLGEDADAAMKREFKEEAGLDNLLWQPKVKMYSDKWSVYVYSCKDIYVHKAVTKTDEEVVVCLINSLPNRDLVPHLTWLIPMVMDPGIINPVFIKMEDTYGGNTAGV